MTLDHLVTTTLALNPHLGMYLHHFGDVYYALFSTLATTSVIVVKIMGLRSLYEQQESAKTNAKKESNCL